MIILYLLMFMIMPAETVKEETVTEFYAMEYVNVFGNRILKVWITDEFVFAAKVKGMTAEGIAISSDSKFIIPRDKRNEPKSYVNTADEIKYSNLEFTKLDPKEFMKINRNNFVIKRANIISVIYNPKKKWGMGEYPHNGRIIIKSNVESSNNKSKREFILIGQQDEKRIMNKLE